MKKPNHTLSIYALNANDQRRSKPSKETDSHSLMGYRRRMDRKLRILPYSDLPLIGPNRLPPGYLAA